MDLALSNLERLIYHKTQITNQPTNHYQTYLSVVTGCYLESFPITMADGMYGERVRENVYSYHVFLMILMMTVPFVHPDSKNYFNEHIHL